MAVTATATATRLQGGIFTLMVVKIADPYDPILEREIGEQVAMSPAFFAQAPVVLDLKDSLGCTAAADFTVVKEVLARHQLVVVGVQNASALQVRAAQAAALPVLKSANVNARRPAPERVAPSRPKLVTQPVRSGTQIYAKGTDLIIVAPVSAGAEVIADGHIHVYGALRGRALAGAAGDQSARIFTQRLEAELVSIAGRYLVNDAIAPELLQQPAQVALIDDHLTILPGWSSSPGATPG
jgi:septum site-determining protein MinC